MELLKHNILSKVTAYVVLVRRYLHLVFRRFLDDGCQHSAAALTYMTLFAVVPMMTLTFSMFSAVPAFKEVGVQVQNLIFSNFVPSAGVELQSYLSGFAGQARTLSAFGILILLITAYLMLRNIESVFNRIWSTTGRRKGISAFMLYWAVLSLGPLLFGTALIMNTYLLSVKLFTDDIVQGALNMLFGYLPILLTATAFTLLYTVVPNCKVMLRNAVTGGIVATLAFELAKKGFAFFVANSAYSSIYGAFAAIPIFLLWVYLCWIIILAGAEFVRATENFGAEMHGKLPLHAATVLCLWLLWSAHQKGEEVSDTDLRQAGISSDIWRQIRERLLLQKIIRVADSKNYVLAKSLDQLTLWSVLQFYPLNLAVPSFIPKKLDKDEGCWWDDYSKRVESYQLESQSSLSISLADLFEQRDKENKEYRGL